MFEKSPNDRLAELTAEIVSSHVSNAQVASSEIPALVADVYAALKAAVAGEVEPEEEAKPEAAVSVRKSLADPQHIISMIDGKPYKALKRHLGANGYTPESYRATFGLPVDYPMVAPAYSEARAAMARARGLGRQPTKGRKPKA